MNRTYTLFSILLLLSSSLIGQVPHHCGSSLWLDYEMGQGIRSSADLANMDYILKELQEDPSQRTLADTEHYVIPVVYHIVHSSGPELVPEANIIKSLEDMNEALANQGIFNPSTGVPINISLCFARTDKFGRPSLGYEWIADGQYNPIDDFFHASNMMTSYAWEPEHILNIYSVGRIAFASAFATFPPTEVGNHLDGIVSDYRNIGFDRDGAEVLVHELGHYLGLYHTFQQGCSNDDCLLQGDRVCDTPPDDYDVVFEGCFPNNNCLTDANDPSGNNPFSSDVPDDNGNYMDYNSGNCIDHFTAGQRKRMRYALRTFRPELLLNSACVPDPYNQDLDIFTLSGLDNIYFDDSLKGRVRIINQGLQDVTAMEVAVALDGQEVAQMDWTGRVRGEGRLVWIDLPALTLPEPGQHVFQVYTRLPNGVEDDFVANDSAKVEFLVPNRGFIPHLENFEEGVSDEWIPWVQPRDRWELTEVQGCDLNGNEALVLKNYFEISPITNHFYSPIFDLDQHLDAGFTFDFAALGQGFQGFGMFSVSLIREGDPNEAIELLYYDEGQLGTNGSPILTTPWVPATCEDWRQESVDLSDYAGEKIVLRLSTNLGLDNDDRLYLDNLRLNSSYAEYKEENGLLASDLNLFPVPASEQLFCEFPVFRPSDVVIHFYDLKGREIWRSSSEGFMGLYEASFDLSNLSDGMYIWQLDLGDQQLSRKVMVQK